MYALLRKMRGAMKIHESCRGWGGFLVDYQTTCQIARIRRQEEDPLLWMSG